MITAVTVTVTVSVALEPSDARDRRAACLSVAERPAVLMTPQTAVDRLMRRGSRGGRARVTRSPHTMETPLTIRVGTAHGRIEAANGRGQSARPPRLPRRISRSTLGRAG